MPQRRPRPTASEQRQAALLKFFKRAGRLKSEPRLGWFVKLGIERPESVADHSYRTALLAMVYADSRGLDAERAVKMALLHDLAESIVGDSIPGQRSASKKRRMEAAAMASLLADLPQVLAREYLSMWEEYEEGRTGEARLVKQLDKLEMAMQAAEYREQDPSRNVDEFLRSARGALKDPDILAMLRVLRGPRAGS